MFKIILTKFLFAQALEKYSATNSDLHEIVLT